MRTRIKFCGMRGAGDVRLAVACGADAVGAILAPESPRFVAEPMLREIAAAAPPFVTRVAVLARTPLATARAAVELGFLLQFSGGEDEAYVRAAAGDAAYLRVIHVGPDDDVRSLADRVAGMVRDPAATVMFDTASSRAGGSGVAFSWTAIAPFARERPVVVAGGLNAENVAGCIGAAHPFAVDVASGIETGGRKDEGKMRAFAGAVREADARFAGAAGTAPPR